MSLSLATLLCGHLLNFLKDKALKESRSPLVLKVFKNYEMSFLVHSAAESGRSIPTHWLEAIGLSTSDLMNARSMK